MFLRDKPVEIPTDDPFANDKLGFKDSVVGIAKLIGKEVDAPFVLTLEAPWGMGKSTYMRMLKAVLKSQEHGHKVLTYNAWEFDGEEDPLLPFVAEVARQLSVGSERAKQVKKMAAAVFLHPIKKLAAYASLGVANPDDVAKTLQQVEDHFDTDLDRWRDESKKLHRLFAEIIADNTQGEQRIIIQIDELDRCRPDHAVLLLERIKHIFSVENVVFILGVDREQLGNAVKGVFGESFNGSMYLRKFTDLSFEIRPKSREAVVDGLMPEEIAEEWKYSVCFYAGVLNLDTRTLIHLINRVSLVNTMFRGLFPPLTVQLIILRDLYPVSYERWRNMEGIVLQEEAIGSDVPEALRHYPTEVDMEMAELIEVNDMELSRNKVTAVNATNKKVKEQAFDQLYSNPRNRMLTLHDDPEFFYRDAIDLTFSFTSL